MKPETGNMGSFVLLLLFLFSLMLMAADGFAQETTPQAEDGKVDVIYPAEARVPYRERRGPWSVIVGANMDQVLPSNFRSKVSDDSYEALFGQNPLSLIQIEIGGKYNFGLGAVAASAIIGQGEISDNAIGTPRSLSLLKKGFSASWIMDALFSEPYVAPYIGGQLFFFDWSEGDDVVLAKSSQAGTTSLSSAVSAGLLIQLNWIDPDASLFSQSSIGLENAYLDIFVSQYNTSQSETDPNFETDVNFGAGLKLEF